MTEMPPYLAGKSDEKNNEDGDTGNDSDSSSDADDWDKPLNYDKPMYLEPIKGPERVEHTWRVKEKYKTHCVALVLCLNVGVDPPDVVKTQPCARLECWTDPQSLSPSKALESIGHALQAQYERWQPRARYKQSLDPTAEEVKKLCCSLRRNAKDERVLFHYNGHGVPKPTSQGEIWVFNRAYTQYIPLSMYDLQTWMGAPSLYVYDCSNAGVILDNFRQFAEQHEREYEAQAKAGDGAAGPPVSYKNCIQLGACAAGQSLPMNPELPADLFTACLTTPVKMAMKWFVLRTRTRVAPHHVLELIDKIPGQVTDRRTMLGELNWIFTAITDTIAWSSLPAELFQQLFRADLLTASLCRNFLLADRIMRSYNCTPVSLPALPSLARHPLWAAWEHTLDLALAQLPALLASPADYRPSPFFRDQLQAFQVWLELGSARRPPPQQLPMVLQVLLSTLHRLRALQLLCRFLALGAWAVRAVLHVGIFPYMLKLLQASAPNLRASMVYIWARIIAVDPSCQVDLVNAKGHKYFLSVLQDPTVDCEHRRMAAYVLAGIVDKYRAGQEAALQGSMISICLEQVAEAGERGGAREEGGAAWACVGLARLWRGLEAARWAGARDLAHEKLFPLVRSRRALVRAAAVHALAAFVAAPASEHANALHHQVAVHLAAALPGDCSPLVRCEVLAALQWTVLAFEPYFVAVYVQERRGRVDPGLDALAGARDRTAAQPPPLPSVGFGSVYTKLWASLAAMAREPHPRVAAMAADILAHVAEQVDSVGRDPPPSSASLPPSPHEPAPAPPARRRALLPHTISEDSVSARDRDKDSVSSGRDRDSMSSNNSSQSAKKPIVESEFVEWAAAQFARPDAEGEGDCESRAHHERAWTRARNNSLRKEAKELRKVCITRLETQTFHYRCPLPPSVVLFHPYEQHIAVASKDNFGVWDWGSAAKLCGGGWVPSWGRVTSLAWVGPSLVCAAAPTGNVALFRAAPAPAPAPPVAAWRALPVRRPPAYRPPPAQPLYSLAQLVSDQFISTEDKQAANKNKQTDNNLGGGSTPYGGSGAAPATLVAWCARSRQLAVAGHSAVVRLWDLEAELLAEDIPTQTEASVSCLWRGRAAGGELLVCGFSDGVVRAWDPRAPAPARAVGAGGRAHTAHAGAVLRAVVRGPRLVSACAAGEVRALDLRTHRAITVLRAPAPLAAVDIHPICDLLACGSVNQSISIYDLKGNSLNTIKFHEGLLGARIGPVSCLTFHPYRVAMGVGSKDSSVSVYVSEPRR